MKPTYIKDLIKKLEEIQALKGNLEVWVEVPNPDTNSLEITAERISAVNISYIPIDTHVCVIKAEPA